MFASGSIYTSSSRNVGRLRDEPKERLCRRLSLCKQSQNKVELCYVSVATRLYPGENKGINLKGCVLMSVSLRVYFLIAPGGPSNHSDHDMGAVEMV